MAMNSEISSTQGALRWIGDLDHPFYDDERQRFIWYEASTIAFQIFLFALVGLAGAMLWIGGAEAIPYAISIFLVQSIAGVVAISYAKAHYAEYVPKPSELTSRRNLLYAALVAFAGSGFLRAVLDVEVSSDGGAAGSFFGGAAQGVIAGLICVPFIIGGIMIYKRRQEDKADDDEFQ